MKFSEHALNKMLILEHTINAQSDILEGKYLRAEKSLAEAIAVLHELQKEDFSFEKAGGVR